MTASAIESDSLGIVSSRAMPGLVVELVGRQIARERRGKPALPHLLQLLVHVLLELVEDIRFDAFGLELRPKAHDRVAGPPLVELSVGPVVAWIAPRVTDEAIGQRLDECRPVAAPPMRERPLCRVADSPDPPAVD